MLHWFLITTGNIIATQMTITANILLCPWRALTESTACFRAGTGFRNWESCMMCLAGGIVSDVRKDLNPFSREKICYSRLKGSRLCTKEKLCHTSTIQMQNALRNRQTIGNIQLLTWAAANRLKSWQPWRIEASIAKRNLALRAIEKIHATPIQQNRIRFE